MFAIGQLLAKRLFNLLIDALQLNSVQWKRVCLVGTLSTLKGQPLLVVTYCHITNRSKAAMMLSSCSVAFYIVTDR